MLSLQLKSGEYLTIGDDIAIQIFQQSGSAFSVAVKAPKEIPILRGAVAEHSGEQRSDGLRDQRSKTPSEKKWDARRLAAVEEKQERERAVKENKAAALNGMQESIDRMEAMLAQEKQRDDTEAALQKELRLLRMQLKRVMAAETISVEAKTMRSERTAGSPKRPDAARFAAK